MQVTIPQMTPPTPRVSIVIPTYRRPDFLSRAIASILAQTFRDWELVVVDDNGVGTAHQVETFQFMRRYSDESRIQYVAHEKNRGGSEARNTGVWATVAEYVAFLDDDDEWLPDKLRRQVDMLDASSGSVGVVYTGAKVVQSENGEHTYFESAVACGRIFEQLLARNAVGTTSSILCRRERLIEVGLFDASLGASQDYDLYLRLARVCAFACIDEPLVVRHKHGADRITKNIKTKISASSYILKKYASAFAGHAEAHSEYLLTHGQLLIKGGRRSDAVVTFWRSFASNPKKPGRLLHALLAAIGPAPYQIVRTISRPPRLFLRRMRRGWHQPR